jgi:hypothetical protein
LKGGLPSAERIAVGVSCAIGAAPLFLMAHTTPAICCVLLIPWQRHRNWRGKEIARRDNGPGNDKLTPDVLRASTSIDVVVQESPMAPFHRRRVAGVGSLTLAVIAHSTAARDLPVKGGPSSGFMSGPAPGSMRSASSAHPSTAQRARKRPGLEQAVPRWQRRHMPEKLCPPYSVVAGIRYGCTGYGNRPKFLDFIVLARAKMGQSGNLREWTTTANECISTNDGCWSRHPTSNSTGLSFWNPCEADQVLVGIHGRAGAFVDTLGLIYGPKPQ